MNSGFRLNEGVVECNALLQFPWLQHGFGTRQMNPEVNVTLRQIHSANIFKADGLKDREEEGDALVTDRAGLTIGVRTADCVPILLADGKRQVVAAVHAGWRGSAAEIVLNTVRRMTLDFDTQPADVWAAIGPCIGECCYEVGPEVWEQFHPHELAGGKRKLNLVEANRRQLDFAGVPLGQIFESELCTACEPELLYSFRREPGNPGRMLSCICRLF